MKGSLHESRAPIHEEGSGWIRATLWLLALSVPTTGSGSESPRTDSLDLVQPGRSPVSPLAGGDPPGLPAGGSAAQMVPIEESELPEVDPEGDGPLDRLEAWVRKSTGRGPLRAAVEYQLDTRGFDTLHLEGAACLPLGLGLSGFVDFHSPDGEGRSEDKSEFFLEIDLRREIWNGLGALAELNDQQGRRDALGRFGLFWKPSADFLEGARLRLFVKILPLETDGHGGQVSCLYHWRLPGSVGDRVSVAGFFDANYGAGSSHNRLLAVTETQLRLRLVEGLHVFTEVKLNRFLGGSREFGVGFGLQYRFGERPRPGREKGR